MIIFRARAKNLAKLFAFNIIQFLLVLVVIFLAFEVFARYMVYKKGVFLKEIYPQKYQELFESDPPFQLNKGFSVVDEKFGVKHTPDNEGIFRGYRYPNAEFKNFIKINSSGFRSSVEYADIPQKLRIAVLGDSFVEALEVKEEDSFPKVIESNLNKKGFDTFVYNFGLMFSGTVNQYLIFNHDIVKYNPDIIVLAFFRNDLIDNSPYYFKDDIKVYPKYHFSNGKIYIDGFSDVKDKEKLVEYDYYKKGIVVGRWTMDGLSFIYDLSRKWGNFVCIKYLHAFLHERFFPKLIYHSKFDIYRKKYPPQLQESFKVTVKLIEQMSDYCKDNGIEFLVAVIPAREQFYPSLWKKYLQQRNQIIGHIEFDLELPNSRLDEELNQKGISCINLLPIFRKKFRGENLYYINDAHFNNNGHRRAGEVIAQHIVENYLK